MNAVWYNAFDTFLQGGSFAGWGSTTVLGILVEAEATTPDNPDHDFLDDIVADESAATGYSRQTLAGLALAVDATNNRAELTFDPIDFGAIDATGSPLKGLILCIDGANDAARRLICGFPLPDLAPDGSGFILSPGSEGAIQFGRGTLA